MNDSRPGLRTAEKVAAVIAVIAALIVLNGAWENQHTFQNVGWRVVMAALLVGLAAIVETNAVGMLQERLRRGEDYAVVPNFLRNTTTLAETTGDEGALEDHAVPAVEHR